jgi:hypothetical protein
MQSYNRTCPGFISFAHNGKNFIFRGTRLICSRLELIYSVNICKFKYIKVKSHFPDLDFPQKIAACP